VPRSVLNAFGITEVGHRNCLRRLEPRGVLQLITPVAYTEVGHTHCLSLSVVLGGVLNAFRNQQRWAHLGRRSNIDNNRCINAFRPSQRWAQGSIAGLRTIPRM